MTLVVSKQALVPDAATAGLPSVGLRMPAHPVALALIAAAGVVSVTVYLNDMELFQRMNAVYLTFIEITVIASK